MEKLREYRDDEDKHKLNYTWMLLLLCCCWWRLLLLLLLMALNRATSFSWSKSTSSRSISWCCCRPMDGSCRPSHSKLTHQQEWLKRWQMRPWRSRMPERFFKKKKMVNEINVVCGQITFVNFTVVIQEKLV